MSKKEKDEDVNIPIHKQMALEIVERRQTSTSYAPKEGYSEVGKETKTGFDWKLRGIAAKLDHTAEDFDPKDQEIFHVEITSHTYDAHVALGFKTREKAIQNAMEYAKRNGLEVDGYGS